VASQAGPPASSWNRVWIRSGSMAATSQPPAGENADRSSSWLTGCGPVAGPSGRKHSTYSVAPGLVTEARLAV
jgi:hypothetical protein